MKESLVLGLAEFVNQEPIVCAMFGCPNHLTAREKLHGDYCSSHSELCALKNRNFITLIANAVIKKPGKDAKGCKAQIRRSKAGASPKEKVYQKIITPAPFTRAYRESSTYDKLGTGKKVGQ